MRHLITKLVLPLLLVAILVAVLVSASPSPEHSSYVDSHWWYIKIPEDVEIAALLAHEVDAGEVIRHSDIPILEDAGFTILHEPEIGYYILFTNCRVHPFDSVPFRNATFHAVDKDTIIEAVYGPTVSSVDYYLPPGQIEWINDAARLPQYNLQEAINILMSAGYEPILKSDGEPVPGNIENWIDPLTGLPLPDIEFPALAAYEDAEAWESAVMMSESLHEVGIPVELDPESFMDLVYRFYLGNWQLAAGIKIVWGTTSPDPLSWFFHSESAWNIWGINDATLDYWCNMMMSTLVEAECKEAAKNIQGRAVELLPYLPLWVDNAFTAFTGPVAGQHTGCIGIVNAKGFGAISNYNRWGKLLGRKTDPVTGGVLPTNKWVLKGYIDTLNPSIADSVYDWQVLDLIVDDLIVKNPYTHEYIPWVAAEMPHLAEWTGPNGEIGMTMRFTLRDDVYWHDGVQVNASDCVFALNLLRYQENVRNYYVWAPIYDVELIDTYTFKVYYLMRYYWAIEGIAGAALQFPEHIWRPFIAGGDGKLWTEDDRHHSEWTGWEEVYMEDPQYPGQYLTKLVGCGSFIYHHGSLKPGVSIHVEANRQYFASRIIQSDVDLNQIVDMRDVWQVLYRQGAEYCNLRWHKEFYGMTGAAADIAPPAQKIGGEEIYMVVTQFGQRWGPE